MNGNYFLDTNILVYIHDRQSPEKQKISKELLYNGLRSGNAVISSQVVSEYFVTADTKLRLPYSDIVQIIHHLGRLSVVELTYAITLRAITRTRKFSLSFWDSLIVEAAICGGCSVLYTEDLQHGQVVDGITVHNPYKA